MPRVTRVVPLLGILIVAAGCADPEVRKQRAFESGERHFAEGSYQEAILEYRTALGIDDRFAQARRRLADAHAAAGEPEHALRAYVRAADLLPGDADVQLTAAAYLMMNRAFQDARTRLEALLAREPGNVRALVLLGNTLSGLTQDDSAILQLEEALRLDPDLGLAHASLGLIHRGLGNVDAAREAFETAVTVDPASTLAWIAYGNFQLSVSDLAGATVSFGRAHALAPDDVLTNRALALVYLASGRTAEAESHLVALVRTSGAPASTFALAEFYRLTGRSDEARALLAPLRSMVPTFAEATARVAQIDYDAGHRDRARAALERVLAREPSHPGVLLMKARWLAGEGDWDGALQLAISAVNARPRSIEARYLLGLAQAATGRSAQAILSFNEVLSLNPYAAAAQVQLSRLQLARGEVASAVQLARDALRNVPDSLEARVELVRGHIAERRLAEARTDVAALLQAHDDTGIVHVLDGILRLERRDLDGARRAYTRALDLDASLTEAVVGLSAVHLLSNEPDAARALVEAHIARGPDRPVLLVLAARLYAAGRDWPRAEHALRRALEADHTQIDAYRMLGDLYAAQGRLDAAVTELDAAPDGGGVALRTMSAIIRHAQGRTDEAITRYRDVLAIDPDAAVAGNNLASLYAEQGEQLDLAIELATRASERLGDRAEVWDTLGWVYHRKRLPAMAIRHFEQAIKRAPEVPTYRYRLGLVYLAHGDQRSARGELERALALDPNLADARRALDGLMQASAP